MIDLRSDTVTVPTAAMRQASLRAAVGDDVHGEDPTVAALEALAADLVGKEAALFCPSGTMANLCAMLTHCERGRRVVVGADSHIFRYEAGGASALGGLVLHPIANTADGGLDLAALDDALAGPDDVHVARPGLVALENTHNVSGGTVVPADHVEAVAARARAAGVPVHLDGARLFNAAIASGVGAAALAAPFDSVQLCLSKGLAAPVGSMLAGSPGFIAEARRARKLLGGGMRQAGVVAAYGVVALTSMVARLADDHAVARALADRLRAALGDRLEVAAPQTNIVLLGPRGLGAGIDRIQAGLAARGVLVGPIGAGRLRAVTHLGVGLAEVDQVVAAFDAALADR